MRPLSLAHLSFLHLPPPDLIRVAAAAGFSSVGLRLIAVTETTPGYALMHDHSMMNETLAALRGTGVCVNDIEFVRLTPEFDPAAMDAFLDAGAELGARYIVTAPYDPDLDRLSDNLAAFADRSATFGLSPVLEFFPWTRVADLRSALAVVAGTGRSDVGVLLDSLHFDRSDSDLTDIATAGPGRLPFIHLCDAMVQDSYTEAELLHTARAARLMPGDGQIDLGTILMQLPRETQIALELPMQHPPSGLSDFQLARRMFEKTQTLLERHFRG